MLTEKEYLLLCELVSLNKLNTKLNSSGKTVVALLEANKDIINAE
jgi:hypothetical protein